MFGLLTGIMGFALINPISVGAGLLLGGKAYREDKESTRTGAKQQQKKKKKKGRIAVWRGWARSCLQVGCIPSKALIESAQAAAHTREFERMGFRVGGDQRLTRAIPGGREQLCRGLTRGVAELLAGGRGHRG